MGFPSSRKSLRQETASKLLSEVIAPAFFLLHYELHRGETRQSICWGLFLINIITLEKPTPGKGRARMQALSNGPSLPHCHHLI